MIIPWIISLSGGRLAARGARIALIAALAALALAGAALWLHLRDNRMIETHDAAQTIEVLETTGAADGNAAVTRRADDAVLSNQAAAIERVIQDAPAPTQPISVARSEFYRCLRQQRAGVDCLPASNGPSVSR